MKSDTELLQLFQSVVPETHVVILGSSTRRVIIDPQRSLIANSIDYTANRFGVDVVTFCTDTPGEIGVEIVRKVGE